jgi:hypothetical protein
MYTCLLVSRSTCLSCFSLSFLFGNLSVIDWASEVDSAFEQYQDIYIDIYSCIIELISPNLLVFDYFGTYFILQIVGWTLVSSSGITFTPSNNYSYHDQAPAQRKKKHCCLIIGNRFGFSCQSTFFWFFTSFFLSPLCVLDNAVRVAIKSKNIKSMLFAFLTALGHHTKLPIPLIDN